MVAEVSGHNAKFITHEMPLVQVYQFRTLWFDKRGIEWIAIGEDDTVSTMQ